MHTTNISTDTFGDIHEADLFERQFSRILILTTFPLILVIGTIGNVLTFIVMRRGSLKHSSTCFYMAVLAIADSSKSKHNVLFCCVVKNKQEGNLNFNCTPRTAVVPIM